MKEIKTKLNTSANVIRVLGDQLISNESVALTELIKNSYDAKATNVKIIFNGPLKMNEGEIIIEDNGYGMDLKTIKEAWMVVASNFKKIEKQKSKQLFLGEKGIGRFSAAKLARKLIMITRAKNNDEEIEVEFDWEKFSELNKMLEDLEILIKIYEPKKFKNSSGTILKLIQLNENWNKKKIERILNNLSRLINPVKPIEDFKVLIEFNDKQYQELSGYLKSPKALENPMYKMKGKVNSNGSLVYSFVSIKQKDPEEQKRKNFETKLKIENFISLEFEFRVWDLDSTSLKPLSESIEISWSQIKDDVQTAAGISLYRDMFRVLPYGESNNDWLRLDLLRVNQPTLRLSNNQIVGTVLIKQSETPELKDQSNREGLIENQAFEFLKDTILYVLDILERKRYPLKKKKPIFKLGVVEPIETKSLIESIEKKEKESKSKKSLDIIDKIDSKIDNKNLEIIDDVEKTKNILKKMETIIDQEKTLEKDTLKKELKRLNEIQNKTAEGFNDIKELKPIIKDLKKNLENDVVSEQKQIVEEKKIIHEIDQKIKRNTRKIKADFEIIKEDQSIYRRLSTLGLMVDKITHDGITILSKITPYIRIIEHSLNQPNYNHQEIIKDFDKIVAHLSVLDSYYARFKFLGGQKSRKITDLNLKEIIEDCFEFWKKDIENDKIRIILPNEKYFVKIIPSDFLVIFFNLITNSLYWLKQLGSKKDKMIQITLRKQGNSVYMIFSDNGPGIDPDDIEMIFLPYMTKKENGIGLGLTIVKETIESYKGTINVIDGPLNGANFEIKFLGV